MKIKLEEVSCMKSFVGHIVLNGIVNSINESEISDQLKKTKEVEVTLTIGGFPVDLRAFVDQWQKQVNDEYKKRIKDKATELFDSKFMDVRELLTDLEERLEKEVEERLEDWEKNEE